ncbi:MAG: hypothetical protein MUE87_04685 [Methanothrix sp.]|nr:hypothetical protein [Methanothrix sp.]
MNRSLKTIHHFPHPFRSAIECIAAVRPLRITSKQVLGLPENLVVECMIAFGYPDEDKEPVAGEQLEYEKIK